jgi:hypothetical protein
MHCANGLRARPRSARRRRPITRIRELRHDLTDGYVEARRARRVQPIKLDDAGDAIEDRCGFPSDPPGGKEERSG